MATNLDGEAAGAVYALARIRVRLQQRHRIVGEVDQRALLHRPVDVRSALDALQQLHTLNALDTITRRGKDRIRWESLTVVQRVELAAHRL